MERIETAKVQRKHEGFDLTISVPVHDLVAFVASVLDMVSDDQVNLVEICRFCSHVFVQGEIKVPDSRGGHVHEDGRCYGEQSEGFHAS